MDLKEFVQISLTQIAEGVRGAQEAVHSQGGFVNPPVYTSGRNEAHFGSMPDGQNIFLVDFDVAVTVSEEKGTAAAAKLKVASVFTLGGDRKSSGSEEYSNRLRFKVPLALPVDPDAKQQMQTRQSQQDAQIARYNDDYQSDRI